MLQIFTYSTGLAFTGISAACAPATATKPAAEPRRRLLTIFIVTSNFVSGGVRGRSPAPRLTTRVSLSTTWYDLEPGRGDLGMPPSVAIRRLREGNSQGNDEPTDSKISGFFFCALLHKWKKSIHP